MSWSSKAFELLLVAVRWYVIAWGLLVGYLALLCLLAGLGVPLYFYLQESQGWRLFEIQAVLLPIVGTAFVYWLMEPEHRHPRAVVLALSMLVSLGTTSIPVLGMECGLGLLGAGVAYTAFKFERRWLAQTITLALGAMLVGFEVRAWYDTSLERRDAVANCEAKGGVLGFRRIRGELVCLVPR